jgi:hypothetical protein
VPEQLLEERPYGSGKPPWKKSSYEAQLFAIIKGNRYLMAGTVVKSSVLRRAASL